jgi:hypothetical protein
VDVSSVKLCDMLAKIAATVAVASLSAAMPATVWPAAASSDDNEARIRVACAGGKAELRVRAESRDDDSRALRVDLRVDTRRPFPRWRIVLLHERTLVFNGVRRSHGSHRRLRLALTLPDWPGRETVRARLTTHDVRTCQLGATI